MENYKQMFRTLFQAVEQTIDILIAAQQECEELYVSSAEHQLNVIPLPEKKRTRICSLLNFI